jgi:phosphatidylglycerophosphate synthase
MLDQWLLGVLLIQVFGIFSCIDGEIARIQSRTSRIGDFMDTMTDRVTELALIGACAWSLGERVDPASEFTAGFALLGGVFLLTISSEKFRSAHPISKQSFWCRCSRWSLWSGSACTLRGVSVIQA